MKKLKIGIVLMIIAASILALFGTPTIATHDGCVKGKKFENDPSKTYICWCEKTEFPLPDDDDRYVKLKGYDMVFRNNNIYCVSHNQAMFGTIKDTEVVYEIFAKAELKGNTAQFTNYHGGEDGQTKVTGTSTHELNNKMAALLSNAEGQFGLGYAKSSVYLKGYGYEARYSYSDAQLALYYLYDDWVKDAGAGEYGFGAGNPYDIGEDKGEAKEKEIQQKINSVVVDTQYTATIFFIRYLTENNPGGTKTNLQNLLITEPGDPLPKEKKVPVEKIWEDEAQEGNRPESITVRLYKNGEPTEQTLELSAKNNWKGVFEGLPALENDEEIQYTVKEENVPAGYITSAPTGSQEDGWIITNTPETTDVPVAKVWSDNNNQDGKRTSSVIVELYANNEATGETAELSDSNNWSYIFKNVPKYKNKKEIAYTVVEKTIDGYTPIITGNQTDGYVITNTHEPEKIEIKVNKVWDDKEDLDGLRPSSITVTLYADEVATDKTAILDESNKWTATFADLDKYKDGKEIIYTVKETGVPTGYTTALTGDVTNGFTITNTHIPNYDGYIEISGKVWEDAPDGKGNDIDGVFGDKDDDKDIPLEGITVRLKYIDENGMHQIFDKNHADAYETVTDANGQYVIKVNYDNSENVYKLYEDATKVQDKLKTAYVEFEYNGIKYTTVKTADSGENTSRAKENESRRSELDVNYSTVKPETKAPESENITAVTKDVISFETYADKKLENRPEDVKYCNGNGTFTHTNPNGAWNDVVTGQHTCANCKTEGHSMKTFDVEVLKIENVNLGLFKREQPDVAIKTELSKVQVIMKEQAYTYLYNKKTEVTDEKAKESYEQAYQAAKERGMTDEEAKQYAEQIKLQVKFQTKDTYVYRRPINPADIAYVNDGNDNAMKVLVTYEVKVANLSTTLPVTVHNIINSFDSRYELDAKGWTVTAKEGFKQATSGDLNITVKPGHESDAIELTYTVSIGAIKSLLKEDATLNNAVEIGSYSTTYGTTTLYAEQQTGGRTGNAYGGYDDNSHPGNAEIFINDEGRLEAAKPEDDTDIAPSFVLCKDKETTTLSGTVWEDSDKDNGSGPNNFRVGDGALTDKDGNKKVANVKVELYKVNADGKTELAYLYNKGTNAHNEEKKAITYTDNEGNYSFGDDNYGVVTDTYMIKFIYGDAIEKDGSIVASTIDGVKINARNYKSTIISKENVNLYNVFKGESSTDEWHLNMRDGYSIAVDDIEERLKLEDLQYSNFDDPFNMVAYSKTFKMQLEFDPSTQKTVAVGDNGKTDFGNNLKVFDFGIIERAREDIFVETTIDHLKITLANGQVLTEGKPGEEMPYAKAIGFNQTIANGTSAKRALDKQLIAEIDAELLQGAQLEVKYAIKVTNNSEKEYDYYVGDQIKTEYYYFGTNEENAPEIKGSVNYLVDYLDAELDYTWENADDWKLVTAADLRVEGQELVSEPTMNAINSGKYVAYATTKYSELSPGEPSETDYLTARKVLSNKEENVYDNHAEILKINAKVARTTNGKDYKPGNYIPSVEARRTVASGIAPEQAGMHEQDDDRVKLTITPPTGAANYIIIYVIAGLVGLIVMVVGVIFIKKKVLTK